MSSNCFQELDYFIFCVTDNDYIDNTYVSLHSFYKFNDYPVTVYVLGKRTKKFNEFKNVTVKYFDFNFDLKHPFYKNLKPVLAKLKIFDESSYPYNLSFDTDTLFNGNIDEVFKDYKESLIGVNESEKNEINAGFIIVKKPDFSIFDKFKTFTEKHGLLNCPEQDFLNFIFKNSRENIDTKYNVCYWTDENFKDKFTMFHYAGEIKPFYFHNIKYEKLNKFQLSHFKIYFNYCKNLKLSKKFKEELKLSEKNYELLNSLFHYSD